MRDIGVAIAKLVEQRTRRYNAQITSPSFRALVERVKMLIRQSNNPYEVAAVCIMAADWDGPKFTPSGSLRWVSYDFLRKKAEIVDDSCWQWVLWILLLDESTDLFYSVRYWYTSYVENSRDFDKKGAALAQRMLHELWEREVGDELW